MDAAEEFERVRVLYPDAGLLEEGGQAYVHLPALPIATPQGAVTREAILSPHAHSGYMTRLFLSESVPSNVNNWTTHILFTRPWFTWSWQNVEATQPWTTILANHLAALR
ncbi:hypothetical protein [Sphingopyxis sp. H115]|jgi:hypothetical protein|uniref:hypothetical protein n=1 Tax=Sphingopyxis sp. H115 TaxID=1759073 RepID=UPI0007367CF2|nr:hypothetical protein [Sphingopyxis sp. H115]KTE01917.1 hypothetical protein ATE71_20460 [Sphingopyxis sp. H115]MDZ4369279.1 hypothetical protein [Afipia sp.]